MSFPTTPILDTFVRANENPLSDGGKWGGANSGFFTNDPLLLQSDTVISDGVSDCTSYWQATTFGPDCEAYVDVQTTFTTGDYGGLFCRLTSANTGSENAYAAIWVNQAPPQWTLYSLVNGTPTAIQTATGALGSGDSIGMSAIGQTVTVYRKTGGVWSVVFSFANSDHSGAGNIGIWNTDIGPGGGAFQNFGGGTYNPTVPPLPSSGGQSIVGGLMETRPRSEFIS